MNALAKLKLLNAIGYFAREHYRRTGKFLTQIQLFKYLAFLDFWAVKERGKPVIGLRYLAMQWGPVPEDLYREFREIENSKIYETFKVLKVKDEFGEVKRVEIAPLEEKEPDLKLFSEYERKLMDRILEIFADRNVRGNHFSEASHEAIRAWEIAWNKAQRSGKKAYPMSFKDEIEGENKEELLERLEVFETLMGE